MWLDIADRSAVVVDHYRITIGHPHLINKNSADLLVEFESILVLVPWHSQQESVYQAYQKQLFDVNQQWYLPL